MTTERNSTGDLIEEDGSARVPEIPTTSTVRPRPWWSTKAWVIVAVALLLIVYPAARWIVGRVGGGPARDGQALLQASYREYQARRYAEAITAAKAAIAVNPKSAEAYNNMAVSYLGLGRFDEATQAAQEALRLRPDFQLARNNLAWIQQEKAKATRQPTPRDGSPEVGALLNQSQQHAQGKRFKECLETATRASQLDPGSARAFTNMGFCAANLQLWDEAVRNTEQAIRLDPTLQIAKNNLAWMQQERRKASGPTSSK